MKEVAAIKDSQNYLPEGSFEWGLFHYVKARLMLNSHEGDDVDLRENIHQAEIVLRNIPSLYWLGCVLVLKAEYYLHKDHFEKAGIALESAYNIFSRLGARKELLGLNRLNLEMKTPSDLINKMAEGLPYKVLQWFVKSWGKEIPIA